MTKIYYPFFTFIFISLLLHGCSQDNSKSVDTSFQQMDEQAMHEERVSDIAESIALSPLPASSTQQLPTATDFINTKAASSKNDGDKKFIRTAHLQFSVRDIVSATHAIEDIVIAKKGFIIRSTVSNQELYANETRVSKDSILVQTTYQTSGNLSLRVHHTELDETLRRIATVAQKVSYRDVSANEVTFDLLESSLKQERKQEKAKRLSRISEQTKGYKLNDLTAAEEAIDRAKESADNEKVAELRLNDQIEYSSITIILAQQPIIVSAMKKLEESPEPYRSNFLWNSIYALETGWDGLLDTLVSLLAVWPALLLIGIFVYGAYRFFRKK